MSLVHDLILQYLPPKRKLSSRNWLHFDCPACTHRGYTKDTRGRGNILFDLNGLMVYKCFNCGLVIKHNNGNLIHRNLELLMTWLGIPREDIQRAKIQTIAILINEGSNGNHHSSSSDLPILQFNTVELPESSIPIEQATELENPPPEIFQVIDYIINRGDSVTNNYQYYWTPIKEHDLNKRFIIPFYYQNRIIGWTARYAAGPTPKNVPKYYNSELPGGYLFNADQLYSRDQKYAIVVEGPLDAISIDGIAAVGSTLNQNQINWLNSSNQEKIVMPDRQKKNQDLIDVALKENWYVSFPDWEPNIKDAADATKHYGRLYTLQSIISSKTNNHLMIEMKRKLFKD